MENPTELRTPSSIAQQGYLVNTIKPEKKDNMKPQYLCAVFADGGRVAFNKSRESGRKDKMRGKIWRPRLRNAINGWKR